MITTFRRLLFFLICMSSVFLFIYYAILQNASQTKGETKPSECPNAPDVKSLTCDINGIESNGCLLYNGVPLVPLSKIQNYFEIIGSVKDNHLIWQHSDSPLHQLPSDVVYNHTGPYMYFHNSNVASRPHVLLIAFPQGVPVSKQWDKKGYFYPIQIAQYGLSHHAKYLNKFENKFENQEKYMNLLYDTSVWHLTNGGHIYKSNQFVSFNSLHQQESFADTDSVQQCSLLLPSSVSSSSCLIMSGFASLNSAILLQITDNSLVQWNLYYRFSPKPTKAAWIEKINFHSFAYFYSMEKEDENKNMENLTFSSARDWRVDLLKAMHFYQIQTNFTINHLQLFHILSISVFGHMQFMNWTIHQNNDCHQDHFMKAADWLVDHQDSQGGWPTLVARRLNGRVRLSPGWYSAMAQGQGISLLMRVFALTKKQKYQKSAKNALHLFQKSINEGGLKTFLFHETNCWYEEYPTQPSLYVLNGFIFSLLGLYDISQFNDPLAKQLYNSGLQSLRKFLPLFDTGQGSLYDLRHWSHPMEFVKGPNRARWSYHAVHVAQLSVLAFIDKDNQQFWNETASRWIRYLNGGRSPHN